MIQDTSLLQSFTGMMQSFTEAGPAFERLKTLEDKVSQEFDSTTAKTLQDKLHSRMAPDFIKGVKSFTKVLSDARKEEPESLSQVDDIQFQLISLNNEKNDPDISSKRYAEVVNQIKKLEKKQSTALKTYKNKKLAAITTKLTQGMTKSVTKMSKGVEKAVAKTERKVDKLQNAVCGHCGKAETLEKTLKKCARCTKILYCDATCQKAHWKAHKVVCKTKAEPKPSFEDVD